MTASSDFAFGPPWRHPDVCSWMAYADWCLDNDKPKEQLRALRFAVGLGKRPRLVLMGNYRKGTSAVREIYFAIGSESWKDSSKYYRIRWVTLVYAMSVVGFNTKDYLTTPLDFPGMVDEVNPKIGNLLREFYYKVSYDIRPVRCRDGSVVYAKHRAINKRSVIDTIKIV